MTGPDRDTWKYNLDVQLLRCDGMGRSPNYDDYSVALCVYAATICKMVITTGAVKLAFLADQYSWMAGADVLKLDLHPALAVAYFWRMRIFGIARRTACVAFCEWHLASDFSFDSIGRYFYPR